MHLEHDIPYAPPPPTNKTQIVKLKWVQSQKANRTRDDGVWHGLFAVASGVATGHTALQECSLTKDWVEKQFTKAFRIQCKSIAVADTTNRQYNKYLYIPAGDSLSSMDDVLPSNQLLTGVHVLYQQGLLDTCLRHSMSSAMHAMGFTKEAKTLALEDSLTGVTIDLTAHAATCFRKIFKNSSLVMKKVFNSACSVDKVTQEDTSWPMVLLLQTSDGCAGSHAITTWKGMIFDSNCPTALCWSQRSLNWCSGKGSTCVGFLKVYRLCPDGYGRMFQDCTSKIGTQVQSNVSGSTALGWVRQLPTYHSNGKQRKGYIVCYTDGSMVEWSQADVDKYKLNK